MHKNVLQQKGPIAYHELDSTIYYGAPRYGHRDCSEEGEIAVLFFEDLDPTHLFEDCFICDFPLFDLSEETPARLAIAYLLESQEESMRLLDIDVEESDDLDERIEKDIHALLKQGISFAEETQGVVTVRRDGIPWMRYRDGEWKTIEVIEAW